MENNLVKEEWLNGIVMMSPRPSYNHMKLESSISDELKKYFKKSCEVAVETALYLTKEDPTEIKKDANKLKALTTSRKAELSPDIAIYCDKKQRFVKGFLGVPQLVVEVLSPSNADDDTDTKKARYEDYGVQEYWIASPMTNKVHVYYLEDNRYTLKGSYDFLREVVKSARWNDLILDIMDIELYTDEDDFGL